MKPSVREMQLNDIQKIADYWLLSSKEHMVAMGVDLAKLPGREGLTQMLTTQIGLPIEERQSFALIWEVDGEAIGHNNVNGISFGESATMHLHIWQPEWRRRGLGAQLLRKSIPQFFENLQLKALICEPYAKNPAPNRTLEKLGFELEKTYVTTPGSLNFEQEVNRWKLDKDTFGSLFKA